MRIQGKVVVVTGGANGIGAAMARRFAADGARGVVVADSDGARAREVADEADRAGSRGLAMRCDVRDEDQVRTLIAGVLERFGQVDLFCSNAGVAFGKGVDAASEEWDLAWRVNVLAHVFAARAVLPSMLVRGVARGHLRRQGSTNKRALSTRGEDQYAARGSAGGERGGAGGGRRRRAAGARAGRRRRGRGTRRRALPDPAAPRGSDLPTAQGGGPGPLAGRHAPPGRRRRGPGRGLGHGSGRGGGLRPWLLGPRGGPVSGQPAPGAGVRWGVTLPLDGVALPAHRELVEELPALGYADVWSAEVSGADAFTPLALAAAWSPALRLGTAIAPAATRGPALLAMSAAAMAEAAPGRFALGIGASSQTIVEQWNAASFEQPFRRTRDTLRFVRRALAGERIDEAFDTFTVRGFRLTRVPEVPPPLLLAALRPGMLRLAGREADGAITNLLAAGDVPKVAAELHSRGQGKELVARLFVCPTEDLDHVRKVGRRLLSTYLNVPVYAEFHRWLGRGAVLAPMWSAWAAGDLRAASAAVPDEVVDELLVHGTPERCRAHLERYVAAGITTPVLALLPTPESAAPGQALAASERALRSLAPAPRA